LNYLLFLAKLTTFKRNVPRKHNIFNAGKSLIVKKGTEDAVLKNINDTLSQLVALKRRELFILETKMQLNSTYRLFDEKRLNP
jgi:hypothetical protein